MSRNTPTVSSRCAHPGAGANPNVHTAHPTSITIESGNAACLRGDAEVDAGVDAVVVAVVVDAFGDVVSGIGMRFVVIDGNLARP